ncbi:MAG: hypothetical protein FWG98_00575 [Candidatus Cloacimonetes bacterium]|nr:hypothetical protein [Candidatus Cloacimonadota bacterium]
MQVNERKEQEYKENIKKDAFSSLLKHKRVEFKDYDSISALHTKIFEIFAFGDL